MPLLLLTVGFDLCTQNRLGMPPAPECTLLGSGGAHSITSLGWAPGGTAVPGEGCNESRVSKSPTELMGCRCLGCEWNMQAGGGAAGGTGQEPVVCMFLSTRLEASLPRRSLCLQAGSAQHQEREEVPSGDRFKGFMSLGGGKSQMALVREEMLGGGRKLWNETCLPAARNPSAAVRHCPQSK